MTFTCCDKFLQGGYGAPHQERQAVADAARICIDISAEGTGVRADGTASMSFLTSTLEQAGCLMTAGKQIILAMHSIPNFTDMVVEQMGIHAVSLSAVVDDLSDEAKAAQLSEAVEGILVKKAMAIVKVPVGSSLALAKACKANAVIVVASGAGLKAGEANLLKEYLDSAGISGVAVDDSAAGGLLQAAAGQNIGALLTSPPPAPADEKAAEARAAAIAARSASRQLQSLPTSARQAILERIAVALESAEEEIMAANAKDVELSEKAGVEGALMQRLKLKHDKVKQLCAGVRAIAAQEEPIRKPLSALEVAEGLTLERVTAPIGVCLIIFEARPDALPQIASLAIRSGNGLLLKGGKEATHSNACLHRVITQALAPDVDPSLISLVTSREGVDKLLALDDVIDLVIPRGSNSLVKYIQTHTRIPVLGHADGICHIYVDPSADMAKASSICIDSKVDYPAACNAVEKVLVHQDLVKDGRLDQLLSSMKEAGIAVHRGDVCEGSAVLDSGIPLAPSNRHEYGTCDLTVEVVKDIDEAITHIHSYGSGHTECILAEDQSAADYFLRNVDSACVNHNASTRFSDGFRFGLGAEVGISTSRIHARGPVGVEGLMTTRWLLRGQGQVVAKDKGVSYTHKKLPLPKAA